MKVEQDSHLVLPVRFWVMEPTSLKAPARLAHWVGLLAVQRGWCCTGCA